MKVAEHVAEFRQNRELLDRLTGGKPVDIEAEHSTEDTAPGVTLEHIARSLDDDRRCLLLARPDTAERIAGRIDNEPKCMRSYSDEDGAHRIYNANGDLRVGPNDVRVYRQASGESVWLYHESEDSVELQTEDGKTLARFSDPEAVFTNPTEYPATESDIEDPDEWNTIKRPVIPTVAFGDDGLDREMIDIIEVPGNGNLRILEGSGERTRLDQLSEQDQKSDQPEISPDESNADLLDGL